LARSAEAAVFDVEALRRELETGPLAPVYVFAGGESLFRREGRTLLREKMFPTGDAGMGVIEYEDPPDSREVLGDLKGGGLFSSGRLVLVDPADRLVESKAEALARYAASPADGACLALFVKEWRPKGDLARAPNLRSVSCAGPDKRALPGWLAVRAKRYGKRLDTGVGQLIVETAGEDLDTLDRHLQNLAAYLGEKPNVSSEDVANLVGGDPQRAVWELVAAVVEGSAAKALSLLKLMERHGVEPLMVIGALAAEFSRLWRLKRMMRDGKTDDEILAVLGRQFQFRLKHLKRRAEEIPPRRLLDAHKTLADYDLAAKTGGLPEELLLECLALKLCGGAG